MPIARFELVVALYAGACPWWLDGTSLSWRSLVQTLARAIDQAGGQRMTGFYLGESQYVHYLLLVIVKNQLKMYIEK